MELVLALENDLVQQEKEDDHNCCGSKNKQAPEHLHGFIVWVFWWYFCVWDIHIGSVGLSVPIAKGGINLLTLGSVIRQRPEVFVTKIYHMPA